MLYAEDENRKSQQYQQVPYAYVAAASVLLESLTGRYIATTHSKLSNKLQNFEHQTNRKLGPELPH